jgi:hypothetical protein
MSGFTPGFAVSDFSQNQRFHRFSLRYNFHECLWDSSDKNMKMSNIGIVG